MVCPLVHCGPAYGLPYHWQTLYGLKAISQLTRDSSAIWGTHAGHSVPLRLGVGTAGQLHQVMTAQAHTAPT